MDFKSNVERVNNKACKDLGKPDTYIKFLDTDILLKIVEGYLSKNSLGMDMTASNIMLRYLSKNYDKCLGYAVKNDFFTIIKPNIESLSKSIEGQSTDSEGSSYRGKGLRTELINNAQRGFYCIHNTPQGSYSYTFNQGDMGMFSCTLEVKGAWIGSRERQLVETKGDRYSDECLFAYFTLKDLANDGIVIDELNGFDEVYICFGVLLKEVQLKYLSKNSNDCSVGKTLKEREHATKVSITPECYNHLIPYDVYVTKYSGRWQSPMHLCNAVSVLRMRKLCFEVVVNCLVNLDLDYVKKDKYLFRDYSNKSHSYSICKSLQFLKGRMNSDRTSVKSKAYKSYPMMLVNDVRKESLFEKRGDKKIYPYTSLNYIDIENVSEDSNEKSEKLMIDKIGEFDYNYRGSDSELLDILDKAGFSKAFLIGSGIEGFLGLCQKEDRIKKDITFSFMDECNIADIINESLSFKIKEQYRGNVVEELWKRPVLLKVLCDSFDSLGISNSFDLNFEIDSIIEKIEDYISNNDVSRNEKILLKSIPLLYGLAFGLFYVTKVNPEFAKYTEKHFPTVLTKCSTVIRYDSSLEKFINTGVLPKFSYYKKCNTVDVDSLTFVEPITCESNDENVSSDSKVEFTDNLSEVDIKDAVEPEKDVSVFDCDISDLIGKGTTFGSPVEDNASIVFTDDVSVDLKEGSDGDSEKSNMIDFSDMGEKLLQDRKESAEQADIPEEYKHIGNFEKLNEDEHIMSGLIEESKSQIGMRIGQNIQNLGNELDKNSTESKSNAESIEDIEEVSFDFIKPIPLFKEIINPNLTFAFEQIIDLYFLGVITEDNFAKYIGYLILKKLNRLPDVAKKKDWLRRFYTKWGK